MRANAFRTIELRYTLQRGSGLLYLATYIKAVQDYRGCPKFKMHFKTLVPGYGFQGDYGISNLAIWFSTVQDFQTCYTFQCCSVSMSLSTRFTACQCIQDYRALLYVSKGVRGPRTSLHTSMQFRTIKVAIRFECISGLSFFSLGSSAVMESRPLLYGSMQFRVIELCNTLHCCFRIHKPCYTLQCMTVHSGLSNLTTSFNAIQDYQSCHTFRMHFRTLILCHTL